MELGKYNQSASCDSNSTLWTNNFILICLLNLAVSIPFHSLLATLPIYISALGGSKETVGLALAYLTIAAVIIRPLTGLSIDRLGRKGILIIGLIIFVIPMASFITIVPITTLLFLRLVQGFGWGICSTSIGTVASDVIPKSRLGEGLGFFGSTASISLALSPAISLWLIEILPFKTLFILCTIFTLAALMFSLAIKYPKVEVKNPPSKIVLIERAALKPSLIMLLVTLTYSSLLSFLALYMKQKGIPSTGLFFTAMALTTLASRPLAGRLIDTKGQYGYNLIVLSGIAAIAAAMIAAVNISSATILILSGLLYGVGFGFIQPSMLALCLNRVPSTRRGAANATYWTAFDIGVAVGSIVWGIIAETWGYQLMFQLNLIPLALAAFLYVYNSRQSLLVSPDPNS
ncbi:MFS transporter [Dendrosporobacter sp. 1207_IL3150]|uniref:MFS transporter n=1 Tax=Dendrosporobacter sp. 1207_IL3150 TaxID=3084054 RepID=UPI002FDB67EE